MFQYAQDDKAKGMIYVESVIMSWGNESKIWHMKIKAEEVRRGTEIK